MGKDFLFYPNWYNFTEFLRLVSTRGKSLKTGLRHLQNRVIQPKAVTLATAVLFKRSGTKLPLLSCAQTMTGQGRILRSLKSQFASLYPTFRSRLTIP
jgi:hypothetical protein